MRFTLTLSTTKPQKLNVLDDEVKKSGATFLMYASACLRRSLDDTLRFNHQTLGALASYTMKVPQQIALESGLFEDTANFNLTVSENILEPYIFYGATEGNSASNRPCYPYVQNEVKLTSYIDELRFIFDWQATGFAKKVKLDSSGRMVKDTSPDEDEDSKKKGQGCDGCPVHPMPPYGPGGRPGGWPPPPPNPWYRPGPNTPAYPVPQPPFPPAPPAPKPDSGSGASRPTGTSTTAATSGIAPGTIMLGDDILTSDQFNALFDDK